jgi:hypothetical protein
MHWNHFASYLFGGAFLANAVPRFVSGMMGRAFQSPFAKPPGVGLSSSTVNVLWGIFNIAAGYWLLSQVDDFDMHNPIHVLVAGSGALFVAVMSARRFGQFHGGNSPGK